MKVALIKPPIIGHELRGTGVYTNELYKNLVKIGADVTLTDWNSKCLNFDVIHFPFFDPFFLTLPFIVPVPSLVTIHDLIPLRFPNYFPRGIKGALKLLFQKESAKKKQLILTDSIASKNDIMRFFGMSDARIEVIYLGVSDLFKKIQHSGNLINAKKKFSLPEKFILHVGDVNYNKNIPALINAFKIIMEKYPAYHLVLVGQGFINPSDALSELLDQIRILNLQSKVIRYSNLKETDLVSFFNLAKLYVQPSLSEGFGLPVLEAFACQTPVVSSLSDSLREIAEGCVIAVDPNSVRSISEGLVTALSDRLLTDKNVQHGLKRAGQFTWESTALKTFETYKRTLGKKV